jgi:hypothetical protein
MHKKKRTDFEITELIIVRARNWDRTFIGSIKHDIDYEGYPIICGEVVIQEGKIWSMATNRDQLCKYLNELCLLKLHYGLNKSAGIFCGMIFNKYFLN